MLELWEMQSTPLVPSFPGPLWLRVLAHNRVLFMGQIELNHDFESLLFFSFKLHTYAKLNCLK